MHDTSLLWWFILWGLYLLLPVVPTIVIYRLFPATAVTVSGPFSNLSINATGAFAAYVVTVLLGYFLVSDIATSLRRMELGRWVVEGRVVLKDATGKTVDDPALKQQLLSQLQVSAIPPFYAIRADELVSVDATIGDVRLLPTFKYRIPEFGFSDRVPSPDVADWDWKGSTIRFREPIVIQFIGPDRGRPQIPQIGR